MTELYGEKLETMFNGVNCIDVVTRLAEYKYLINEYSQLPNDKLFTRKELRHIMNNYDYECARVEPAYIEEFDIVVEKPIKKNKTRKEIVKGHRYYYSKNEIIEVLKIKTMRYLNNYFACGSYDIETRIENTMKKISDLKQELEQLQTKLELRNLFFEKLS